MKYDDLNPLQTEAYRLALRLILADGEPDNAERALNATLAAYPEHFSAVLISTANFLAKGLAEHALHSGSRQQSRNYCEKELFNLALIKGGVDDA